MARYVAPILGLRTIALVTSVKSPSDSPSFSCIADNAAPTLGLVEGVVGGRSSWDATWIVVSVTDLIALCTLSVKWANASAVEIRRTLRRPFPVETELSERWRRS